ncbi:MAG: chromosomal replication initiation protein [Chlamydiae bacterium]|nr:chromosomal replication initiation protein [Chlamydiota bacterium]
MHLWDQFLEKLESEIGKDTVDKWVRPVKIVRFDACNIYLQLQDSFQKIWFKEHVLHRAEKLFLNHTLRPIKIHFNEPAPSAASPSFTQSLEFPYDTLDPQFTYTSFIMPQADTITLPVLSELVGFNLVQKNFSVPKIDAPLYNPIVIFGEEGSGKSHLLSATALALQKAGIQALYVKAESFTEHMIKAIRMGHMNAFRSAYRSSDLLIVDSIEHFCNKSATQEEFFHTFNSYHSAGKLILLSSRLPPKKLSKMEPRLISRFEWGITLSLPLLSKKELPLLLLKKLALFNLSLPREATQYLLATFENPKALVKALETLSYKKHLSSKPLSLEEIKTITSSLPGGPSHQKPSPEKILHAVAESFQKDLKDILGKTQTKDAVFPRKIAMYLLRQKLRMPYMKIGDLFSRDHSTVMSSIQCISKAIEKRESEVLSSLESLERKIAG